MAHKAWGEQWTARPLARGRRGTIRASYTLDGTPTRHDAPPLVPTLGGLRKLGPLPPRITARLDRAFDTAPTRALLDQLGFDGAIARRGVPAPLQAGRRWVVERTQARMNGYGKLRRGTERRSAVVAFCLFLAAAFVVTRSLIRRARTRHRWPSRPTTRRLE